LSCTEFRNRIRAEAEIRGIEDKKQAAVDAVMRLLEDMHNKAEPERQKLLKGTSEN
jgi:hypothetical protein